MLVELRISQLAIVDELVVPLGPGLTVLTGETGAGKSVIAGALALLCGRAVPKELIREGEECAFVEGVFDLAHAPRQREAVARAGVRVAADGMLVLRRELRLQGRNRVVINGLVSSLALLEQLGPLLLAIQSQDQQRELTDATFARDLLDDLAGAGVLREEARVAWSGYRQAGAALDARRREEEAAAADLELWRYQAEELEQAALSEGEEEELGETLSLKRNAGALLAAAAAASERLEGGESPAREDVGAAVAALRPLAGRSQRLAEVLQTLQGAEEALAEAAGALRRFLDALDEDTGGLEELEARKALYEELRRKYRRDVGGLLALGADLRGRVARQEAAQSDLAALAEARETARERLEIAARRLHELRAARAPDIARRAQARIRPLALPALELAFAVEPEAAAEGPVVVAGVRCHPGGEGADRVALLVRTNRGERMGEVAGIVSGGERSRIHLGLTALRRPDREPPLLLCDEIDAGLGMDAARPMAQLLRDLAVAGPVVCITHLPTMAVYGDAHLRVAKEERNGRTVLTVQQLAGEERLAEVARLLGGAETGAETVASRRSYAAALLAQAARE